MIYAGLARLDKFAPSKRPYALKRESFRVNIHGCAKVEAVWAGRKSGCTTASVGELWDYGPKTFDEFVATIDMRYGGTSFAKWDGDTLITPSGVTQKLHSRYVEMLDAALNGFPAVPDGYEGWYYRR